MTTKYAVLRQQKNAEPILRDPDDTGDGAKVWIVVKMTEAATAKAAVAAVVKENGATDGTFIAVPLRSWKPIKVKAEQKTTITFS